MFSCFNQDQPLDRVDFPGARPRGLRQNAVQEKLTAQWIGHALTDERASRTGARRASDRPIAENADMTAVATSETSGRQGPARRSRAGMGGAWPRGDRAGSPVACRPGLPDGLVASWSRHSDRALVGHRRSGGDRHRARGCDRGPAVRRTARAARRRHWPRRESRRCGASRLPLAAGGGPAAYP